VDSAGSGRVSRGAAGNLDRRSRPDRPRPGTARAADGSRELVRDPALLPLEPAAQRRRRGLPGGSSVGPGPRERARIWPKTEHGQQVI
jgi:hypothetical protein